MGYQKFIVDNPICMRRYHLAFDDETPTVAEAKVGCPHCDVVIFSERDHPAVKLLREENLVKVSGFSDKLARECKFQDKFLEDGG